MNADPEEALEFAKISKRENRVYVGNLSYDVRYRDLMEFMRGGGWGNNLRFKTFSFVAIFIVFGRERKTEKVKDRQRINFGEKLLRDLSREPSMNCPVEIWGVEVVGGLA